MRVFKHIQFITCMILLDSEWFIQSIYYMYTI